MGADKDTALDIHSAAKKLLEAFPDLLWEREVNDDHICLTCPNEQNPRFPLTASIYSEEGIFVALSQCGDILECSTDISEVASLVNSVLNDKIAVAIAYPDEEKFEKQVLYSGMRAFFLEEDGEAEAFERFIRKISDSRSFLQRLNTFAFHGIIEVSDWSGNRYRKIYRK